MPPNKRQFFNRRHVLSLTLAVAAIGFPISRLHAAIDDTYIGADQGDWFDSGNWAAGVPNGDSNAIIDNAEGVTVQLLSDATANALTVDRSDALSINSSEAAYLTVNGGAISNSGTIVLASSGSGIYLPADTTLSGGGTIVLSNSQSQIFGEGGRLTTDNVIIGQGLLGPSSGEPSLEFTNSGTITASGGVLNIRGFAGNNTFYNSGLLSASAGTLTLSSQFIDNTGGVVEVSTGSGYQISGTLTGGCIQGLGGTLTLSAMDNTDLSGNISISGTSIALVGTINNYGSLSIVRGGTQVFLQGECINYGTINMTSYMYVNNGAILTGPGTFLMNDNSRIEAAQSGGPLLTISTTVMGDGILGGFLSGTTPAGSLRINNTGTIIASTGTLTLVAIEPLNGAAAFINQGTLRADGGLLILGDAVYDNTGGTVEALHGSRVDINGTVNGGTFLSNGVINVNANAAIGGISGTGSLTIATGVLLTSDGVVLPNLQINGMHTIRPNTGGDSVVAGTSKVSTLTLAGSTGNWSGVLDLTNNALIVEAMDSSDKANKIATLLDQVNQARGGTANTWTGTGGITSSTVANGDHVTTSGMGLAVADAAELPSITSVSSYRGQSVDSNSIIVVAAHTGDVTLDGRIDIADLNAVTSHWQMTGAIWSEGDTTGGIDGGPDGTVGIADLNAVTANWQWGTGSGLSPAAAPLVNPTSSVPEPASLVVVAVSGLVLLGRRRTGHCSY